MTPWLRSLAELRPRLVTRIDDDLNFFAVRASVSSKILQSYGGDLESAVEEALALPQDDDPSWGDHDWRSGKPIIRDLRAVSEAKQLPYFRSDLSCKPEDDPAYKRAVENYERDAITYYHYSRHVLFGAADKNSVEAFDRWADQAGRYVYAWSVLNFKKDGLDTLKQIDTSGHDYWMDYILCLARQRSRGCPLVVETRSSLRSLLGGFDGPHWVLLKSNLFQASVDAIDTLLWRAGNGSDASGPDPTPATGTRDAGGHSLSPINPPLTWTESPAASDKPKRLSADDRRNSVKAMIQALSESWLYGVQQAEIAKRTGIDDSTLCRYLKHPSIKPTWDRYQRDSAGKRPAHRDDLR